MSVYFFYGDEDYNIELEIESMRSKLNQEFISMNFQTLDNPEYPELITALRTPPMMFGKMLIVISSEKYFSSQPSIEDMILFSKCSDSFINSIRSLYVLFVCEWLSSR